MTGQDERFNKDKEQSEAAGEEYRRGGQDTAEHAEPAVKTVRVDLAANGSSGGSEVRAADPPPRSNPSNLPLLLLVLVVLLAGGYLFLSTGSSPEPATVVGAPQKQPIPIRSKADSQVKGQRGDPQRIAVVEKPVAKPVAEKAALQPSAAEKVEVVAEKPVPPVEEPVVVPHQLAAKGGEEAGPAALYSVMVGPFLSKAKLTPAVKQLRELGFKPQQTTGRGMVTMIRLLEGTYPADEARTRWTALKKKTRSAFMLPAGDERALYAGSFQDAERAEILVDKLAVAGVGLTRVATAVEMDGKMLRVVQADQQTAKQVARQIGKTGLQALVVRQ